MVWLNARLLHHLGVPCIVKIRKIEERIINLTEPLYVNPDCVVRTEPNGVVITPPSLYSAFIQVDSELATELKKGTLRINTMPEDTYSILEANNVISTKQYSPGRERIVKVEISGLPTQALLDVTSACNCRCLTCYHIQDLDGYTPPLSDVLQRIMKLRTLGITLFEVTGGEPLLREDLAEILGYIDDIGCLYYVVTNGEFLADINNRLSSKLQTGLGLAISLDGVGELHNSIRQRPGLYEKMMKGMIRVADNGIKLYLIATIHSGNISAVPEMIEVAARFKTTLHLRPVINTGNAARKNISASDLSRYLPMYIGNPNVRNGFLSTRNEIPEAIWYGCGIRKRISINANGRLYPCVMDRSSRCDSILSYNQETLVEMLENETKKKLDRHPKCRDCEYHMSDKIICGGFCRFSRRYQGEVRDGR